MNGLNYKAYEKSLELVYEGATRDYYSMFNAVSQHQTSVARTYMWVSAALIGAYSAALDQFGEYIFGSFLTVTLGGFAFGFGALGFGLCLYAFPARKGHLRITGEGWGEFSAIAYQHLRKSDSYPYIRFLAELIGNVDEAYVHCVEANDARGKWLRTASWVLIFSFLFAVGTGATTLADVHFLQNQDKGSDMSNGSDSNKPTNKPAVPPPPPPAGKGKRSFTTHGEKGGPNRKVFTADSLDKKKL